MQASKYDKMWEAYEEDFQNSRQFSQWLPEADGDYMGVLEEVREIEYQDAAGGDIMAWAPNVRIIEHPEYADRVAQIGFFPPSRLGFAGAIVDPKTLEAPETGKATVAALKALVGQICRFRVTTTISKKDGREYTNAKFLDWPELGSGEDEVEPTAPPSAEDKG